MSEYSAARDIPDETLVLPGETLHLLLAAGGESPAVHQEEQGGGGLLRPEAPCSRALGGESSSLTRAEAEAEEKQSSPRFVM